MIGIHTRSSQGALADPYARQARSSHADHGQLMLGRPNEEYAPGVNVALRAVATALLKGDPSPVHLGISMRYS